jgi:hypothetical protein
VAELKLGRCWADNQTGPQSCRSDAESGDGVEGARPDFSTWAAQENWKERKERFSIFEKRTQTKFKHKFEFNQPKINALACMQ